MSGVLEEFEAARERQETLVVVIGRGHVQYWLDGVTDGCIGVLSRPGVSDLHLPLHRLRVYAGQEPGGSS